MKIILNYLTFIVVVFAMVVISFICQGCSKEQDNIVSSNQKLGNSHTINIPSLADTIAQEWSRGIDFIKKYENNPHPNIVFKDSIAGEFPYYTGSILKFYFNGKLYERRAYLSYQGFTSRPNIDGGWISPNIYLLRIQNFWSPHTNGHFSYDYFLIKSHGSYDCLGYEIRQIRKTIEYGYYTGALFEGAAYLDEVKILDNKIIFHVRAGNCDENEIFSRYPTDTFEIVNCYRKYQGPYYNEWTWQW